MAMISIETGAAQLGVPVETVQAWAQRGLLDVKVGFPSPPPRLDLFAEPLQFVDEEQLHDVAETLGWSRLSAESWDGPEEK